MNKEDFSNGAVLVELSQNHMNTTFAFTVSVPSEKAEEADAFLVRCHEWTTELESILTEFRETSDLGKLKNAAPGEEITVSPHTLELLEESERIANWSGQIFNPSFRSRNALPLRENFGWNADSCRVARKNAQAQLGFGAIGKGYALDVIHQKLLQAGYIHHRLIAGGSSLVFSGSENRGMPWKVGFAFDKAGDRYRGVEYRCLHSPLFVGVSGSLEQGQHIVRAGPVPVEPKMVGVTASSAARADAFSTAIYASPDLAQKFVDGAFILIDNEERLYSNQIFQKYFG